MVSDRRQATSPCLQAGRKHDATRQLHQPTPARRGVTSPNVQLQARDACGAAPLGYADYALLPRGRARARVQRYVAILAEKRAKEGLRRMRRDPERAWDLP